MPPSTRSQRSLGAAISAVASTLLIVSLFLHWYSAPGITAWDIFEVWDLVLAILAALTLADAGARLGWPLGRRLRDDWPLLAGIAATVIVAVNLINPPPAAVTLDPAAGIWIALLAALGMLAGAGLRDTRISVAVERSDPLTAPAPPTAPAAPPITPEPEIVPAPPPPRAPAPVEEDVTLPWGAHRAADDPA